jgi:2'-5' RNA ligase
MNPVRLFTAIELPEPLREQLADVQLALRALLGAPVAWTAPGNFHVTLQFLGEVQEADVPNLRRALLSVAIEPFTLHVAGVGTLPPRGPAAVITAELSGQTDVLERLVNAIQLATLPLGFTPERRTYHAHVTLARLRSPRRLRRELDAFPFRPLPPFLVAEFALFHSTLSASGSHYQSLARFALK